MTVNYGVHRDKQNKAYGTTIPHSREMFYKEWEKYLSKLLYPTESAFG